MRYTTLVMLLFLSVTVPAREPLPRLVLVLDYNITVTNEPLARKIHGKLWAKSRAGWLYDHFCFDADGKIITERVESFALTGLQLYTNAASTVSVCSVSMIATRNIATPAKRAEWYSWMAARGIKTNQRRIWIGETNTVGRLNGLGYYLRIE